MKLVEADIPFSEDESKELTLPPRPEHRRVYVSFLFTFSMLAATVTTVYLLFPARDNELLTLAIESHQIPGEYELEKPGSAELLGWKTGVVGPSAPFPPPGPAADLLGVRSIKVLRRPVAMGRYRIGADEVSFFVMRAHDAPPRRFERQEEELVAISWRSGRWTLVAVGPAATRKKNWGRILGAP